MSQENAGMQEGDKNWIALDTGGTMTDAVVVDGGGKFLVGKFLTNLHTVTHYHEDPAVPRSRIERGHSITRTGRAGGRPQAHR